MRFLGTPSAHRSFVVSDRTMDATRKLRRLRAGISITLFWAVVDVTRVSSGCRRNPSSCATASSVGLLRSCLPAAVASWIPFFAGPRMVCFHSRSFCCSCHSYELWPHARSSLQGCNDSRAGQCFYLSVACAPRSSTKWAVLVLFRCPCSV